MNFFSFILFFDFLMLFHFDRSAICGEHTNASENKMCNHKICIEILYWNRKNKKLSWFLMIHETWNMTHSAETLFAEGLENEIFCSFIHSKTYRICIWCYDVLMFYNYVCHFYYTIFHIIWKIIFRRNCPLVNFWVLHGCTYSSEKLM